MPHESDSFDAAMQRLAGEISDRLRELYPVKQVDLEAARHAFKQQIKEEAHSPSEDPIQKSVFYIFRHIGPQVEELILKAIRGSRIEHLTQQMVSLAAWNLTIVTCIHLSRGQSLPMSERYIDRLGFLGRENILEAKKELTSSLNWSRATKARNDILTRDIRLLLQHFGVNEATARRISPEIVPQLVKLVSTGRSKFNR